LRSRGLSSSPSLPFARTHVAHTRIGQYHASRYYYGGDDARNGGESGGGNDDGNANGDRR